jgi:RNase P subunit RPR2
MGRGLLKCRGCGRFFATGLNIAPGGDYRKKIKFQDIPYRCTYCGEEHEYSSSDLVDEGPEMGSRQRQPPRGS